MYFKTWDNAVGTEKHLLCAVRSPGCAAGGTGRALGSGTGCPPASALLSLCLLRPSFHEGFSPLCCESINSLNM